MNPGVVLNPFERGVDGDLVLSGTAEERFRKVVRWLHARGYFPTPTAIKRQLVGRCDVSDNLNGRESRWRREELAALGYRQGPPTGSHAGYWVGPDGRTARAS